MQPPKKKLWPWIAVVTATLAGTGLFLAYHGSAAPAAPAAAAESVKNGTMRTPVSQENTLEYTVTSLACGTAVKGATPKGRFCTVGIKVRNIGDTARTPGISFAQAYDAQGTAYVPDALAQVRLDQDKSSLFNPLAPAAAITSRLVYDVPAGATLTAVLLHETPAAPASGSRSADASCRPAGEQTGRQCLSSPG